MRKTVGFFDMLTVACLIAPAPFFWMPPLWITALMMPRHWRGRYRDSGRDAELSPCTGARRTMAADPFLDAMETRHVASQPRVAPHESIRNRGRLNNLGGEGR